MSWHHKRQPNMLDANRPQLSSLLNALSLDALCAVFDTEGMSVSILQWMALNEPDFPASLAALGVRAVDALKLKDALLRPPNALLRLAVSGVQAVEEDTMLQCDNGSDTFADQLKPGSDSVSRGAATLPGICEVAAVSNAGHNSSSDEGSGETKEPPISLRKRAAAYPSADSGSARQEREERLQSLRERGKAAFQRKELQV